jgi:putative endonuclease
MGEYAYVYILANGFKKLYVGITTELEIRVQQHKQKKDPNCHTAKYNINRLVYFERFTTLLRQSPARSNSKAGSASANLN